MLLVNYLNRKWSRNIISIKRKFEQNSTFFSSNSLSLTTNHVNIFKLNRIQFACFNADNSIFVVCKLSKLMLFNGVCVCVCVHFHRFGFKFSSVCLCKCVCGGSLGGAFYIGRDTFTSDITFIANWLIFCSCLLSLKWIQLNILYCTWSV